jgi:hypothetical protein
MEAVEITTSPAIELQQVFVRRDTPAGDWSVGWKAENTGAKSLQVTSVRLPHGQFKSAEKRFEPVVEMAPGDSVELQTLVHCDEAPGLVTENAFVIFNVIWLGEEWRIFVRIRVVVDRNGEPESATELISAQKVGFSGVTD